MGRQASVERRGVFVLGMHRSGTSATTRALTLMGLPVCRDSDLLPGLKGNPRGHFESATLVAVNHELLARARGFWWSPPTDGAISDAGATSPFAQTARDRFLEVHPTEQWVCKDPCCCLTLPFWQGALGVSPVIVAVSRNPLEVAGSLHARSGMPKELGLALWERYTRAMLAHMRDRPAFLSDYGDVLDDPQRWCETAHAFLSRAGVHLPPLDVSVISASLEPGLRHRQIDVDQLTRDPQVTDSQVALYRRAVACAGAAQEGIDASLPREDPAMERTLRRARRLDRRVRHRLLRALGRTGAP